jgi:predicted O-methyltransferase YrrM
MTPSVTAPNHDDVNAAIDVLKQIRFDVIQQFGYHFQKNDYYSPLNDCTFLNHNRDLWRNGHLSSGINWNAEGQLQVAALVGRYVDELKDIPATAARGRVEYCWNNDFWNNADALVQYGLVRHFKPRHVVEIGCGWSSMLLARALNRNGTACGVVQVEPYPNRAIFDQLPSEWVHHETILQRAPLDIFDKLEAGDICFYDGSHCVKTASDVVWFFFEVLPRLTPGVVIHLHDIFLPDDYPEEWIFERGQSWNEQYLLKAFLMYNPCFEVLIANRYLWRTKPEELDAMYKGVQPSYGCSFWMLKTR